MGAKYSSYDYGTEVSAASAVVDGGKSKPEAMVRFDYASATPLKNWRRLYRQGSVQALKPKDRTKASGAGLVPPYASRNSRSGTPVEPPGPTPPGTRGN